MTQTVTQRRRALKKERRPLQERLRELHITHDMIAATARCDRTYVVHYFAGRRSGQIVGEAIHRLLTLSDHQVNP